MDLPGFDTLAVGIIVFALVREVSSRLRLALSARSAPERSAAKA